MDNSQPAGGEPGTTTPEQPAQPGADAASPTAETEANVAPEPGAETEQPPEPGPDPEAGKQRLNKRFSELTRTIRQERAAREAAEMRLQAMLQQQHGAQPQPGQPQPAPQPQQGQAFPSFESWVSANPSGTYDDWVSQRAEHNVLAKLQQHQMQAQQRARQEQDRKQIEALASEFDRRADPLRDRYEDFDDTIRSDPYTTHSMAIAIMDDERGPEIAYFLAKSPDESRRIASLNPVAQAKEIGRLSARFAAQTKRETAAPPPPPAVKVGATPSRDPDQARSYQEFVALRREQERQRMGR